MFTSNYYLINNSFVLISYTINTYLHFSSVDYVT